MLTDPNETGIHLRGYPNHSANRRKYLLTLDLIIPLYISEVTLFILFELNKHLLNFYLVSHLSVKSWTECNW